MWFIEGINAFIDGMWAAAGIGGLAVVLSYPFYLFYKKVSNR